MSNIPTDERKAICELQAHSSIEVLPANKGQCTVATNTKNYQDCIT